MLYYKKVPATFYNPIKKKTKNKKKKPRLQSGTKLNIPKLPDATQLKGKAKRRSGGGQRSPGSGHVTIASHVWRERERENTKEREKKGEKATPG